MANKVLTLNYPTSGLSPVYVRMKNPSAATWLSNADGTFSARPLTFPAAAEDANDKQKYIFTITGALANGLYLWEMFYQIGGAQDEANDTLIGAGAMLVINNTEVRLWQYAV